ncbi:MAG: dihydroneopterin aldolase [Chloroflexi bacterium]|nr:dihydroneopterin aldolase [Chloroflexota bacterium]
MAPDRILLEGMGFYGYHGVAPQERALGQRFVVDLVAELDLRPAGASDRLEDTVNYSALYRAVKEEVEGPPKGLLEAVAAAIVERVLREFPQVQAIQVRVAKPSPPIKGAVVGSAAVEVYRRRGE